MYDQILGTDYHLDSSLAAHSPHVKTCLKRIVNEVFNKIVRPKTQSDHKDVFEPQINLFHHFDDVHLACDEAGGPPDSRQLGQALLSVLRMTRLKVKGERQPAIHFSQNSVTTESENSTESAEDSQPLSGTVYIQHV